MQQLAVLQAKVAIFDAGQCGVSVRDRRGGGKRGGRGRGRGAPQGAVGGSLKKCTKCGGNHNDSVCFKVGDELAAKAAEMKKQTEVIEQQATAILSKRKNRPNNRPPLRRSRWRDDQQ